MATSLPVSDWLGSIARESGAFHISNSLRAIPSAKSIQWDQRFTIVPTPPAGPPFDLLVEAKPRLSPQVALDVLRRLRESAGDAVPALCCPVISPRVATMCREAQVGYFDADGNAYLRAPGVLVHVSGRPRHYHAELETASDPFAPKSSRIVRALLSAPGRSWGVLELGQTAGVSPGLASRVKNVLLEGAYLVETPEGLRVRRPRELLDAWQARYKPPHALHSFYMMATPQEAETQVTAWCAANGVPCALAIFSGAWRVDPMVRYNRATVYIDTSSSAVSLGALQAALGAKLVDTGANLTLGLVNDAAVFFEARQVDAVRVVSPLQLYLDLSKQAGRGAEAAQEVFERELRPLFDQASVSEGIDRGTL